MALVPLLWLAVLAYHGARRPVVWWAFAIVLGLSWVADTLAHWVDPWLVSTAYPLAQALVLAAVLLPPPALWRVTAIMLVAGVIAWALQGVGRPDVFTRTVAWMGILVMAWPHRALQRPALTTFGLGWLAWVAYSIVPDWTTWGLYQGVRALGIGVFCWATAPQLARAR